MDRSKRVVNKDGDTYCAKCGRFLGMTCDPFGGSVCRVCFPQAATANDSTRDTSPPKWADPPGNDQPHPAPRSGGNICH